MNPAPSSSSPGLEDILQLLAAYGQHTQQSLPPAPLQPHYSSSTPDMQVQPQFLQALLQIPQLQQQPSPPQYAPPHKFHLAAAPQQASPDPSGTSSEEAIHGNTFSQTDDDLLARVILNDEESNLADILGELDGVNGHTVEQWIFHYAKNSKRILHKINRLKVVEILTPRKNLFRYLSQLSRLDISSEASPSGSPTPPTTIVKFRGGSNKYTKEDVVFFRKFLRHTLRRNPDIKPRQLAVELTKKAPHHSETSWYKYMRRVRNTVQEIREQVRTEDVGSINSEVHHSGPDLHQEPVINDDLSVLPKEEDVSSSSSVDDSELRRQDEVFKRIRGKRQSYLPSEQRTLAKHIAKTTVARWRASDEDWDDFLQKCRQACRRHSIMQWKKWYTVPKNTSRILRMARRFEVRNVKRKLTNHREIASQYVKVPSPSDQSVQELPEAGPSLGNCMAITGGSSLRDLHVLCTGDRRPSPSVISID